METNEENVLTVLLKRVVCLILLTILVTFSTPALATYTLPSDRTINWSLAGSTNWSTTRTQICATLSPSGGSDTTAITNALNSCPNGQVVKLNPGTFSITASIKWPKSGVSLRGSGSSQTIFKTTSGASGTLFDFINGHGSSPDHDWTASAHIAITGGNTKGSTSLTTGSNHGWVVGNYVLIDQANDTNGDPPWNISAGYYGTCNWCSRANGTRLKGQTVKILTVPSSNTVTFTPPLYTDYSLSFTPQGTKATGHIQDISIESLKVDNSGQFTDRIFESSGLYNALIEDVDVHGVDNVTNSAIFFLFNTAFTTIRDGRFHESVNGTTSSQYGIFLHYGCNNNLIENNIFYQLPMSIGSEGQNSGNVIAYNYAFNPKYINNQTWANSFTIMGHGGGTFINLYESNLIEQSKIRVDAGFGAQHRLVMLRNRISTNTASSVTDGRQVIDVEKINYYFSLMGNVLGLPGVETIYQCFNQNNSTCGSGKKVIYRLGYNDPYTNNLPGDTQTAATILRHGDWDYVTNGVAKWDGGADHTLPTSLYLSAKPSFFGSCAWPVYGPEGNPTIKTLPAKDRYAGTNLCAGGGGGGDTTPPSAPTNLQVLP